MGLGGPGGEMWGWGVWEGKCGAGGVLGRTLGLAGEWWNLRLEQFRGEELRSGGFWG